MGCHGSSERYAVHTKADGSLVLSRDHRRLLLKYAPHFIATRMPTDKDEALMSQSWDDVIGRRLRGEMQRQHHQETEPDAEASNATSAILYSLNPETRAVFRNSMHVQSKALVNIVGAIRHILHSPDACADMTALAVSHIQYGVKLEYFDCLGVALIATLRKLGREFWSDDVADAWHAVIAYIICLLIPPYLERTKRKSRQHLLTAPSAKGTQPFLSASTTSTMRVAVAYNGPPSSPRAAPQ
ncbi:hypothetical protein SPRG_09004 [Saprolegnia parasitica CBS 223.65]|uniref:Globin domain-containing protein n=1 Tax=Saprolegnia parasitica (strain CBS 223.65) TaxID=695850 RepID=A0A067C998_SAPPC|nr:hypothetical protein SPRG_09004 [Saprolegnia parasitica CBS 223.65]KDO25705.1 hypothetical protein SPRG_09004 [Saprolegnia parasitica CBS 223.65]|eukprot:XP_012203515.1 hypothetical protein SPRG_09004 [Saprolegnia parasitica CBS 223.65]